MSKCSKSSIFIDRMNICANHGVMEQERVVGGDFEVSVWVDYDFSNAIESDSLADTISYADICGIVKREMAIPSKLLEHVAGRIAKAIIHDFPQCDKVKVKVVKINPPMGADCHGAGVEVEFS